MRFLLKGRGGRRPLRRSVSKRTATISIGDRSVALTMRHDPRAGRIRLKIDGATAGLILTLPQRTSEESGLAFVAQQAAWITERLDALAPSVPFVPGAEVPVHGAPYRIRFRPGAPARARSERSDAEGWEIVVGGRREEVEDRVRQWLRGEAKRILAERARAKAAVLGRPLGRITVRDTRTRWGSCSSRGDLSFCWRLIMAPPHVLDYVAAHEVAHLVERNHGPAFWRTVADLTDEADAARAWLRRCGPALLRYGQPPESGASAAGKTLIASTG